MANYRMIVRQQDAYMVTCDNCGGEDGPYPSPPRDGVPHYCGHCHHTCRENNALELHQGLKGAHVIGFRFSGTNLRSLVLQKGKRVMEVWAPGRGEDGDSINLDFQDDLRLVKSCYTFKRQKPPAMKKALEGMGRFIFEQGQAPGISSTQEEVDEWLNAKRTMTPEQFSAWVDEKLKKRLEGG